MRGIASTAALTAVIIMTAGCADRSTTPTSPITARVHGASAAVSSPGARVGFGFNGTASGFPKGEVFLTGGGSFDPATASNTVPQETDVVSGGGFRCTIGVEQGLLTGCASGDGVRWDTAQLLLSTTFKCSASDTPKTATTGPETAVLLADFYLAGHGNNESFTAPIIVSATDLVPGKNLWIQGVGCGTAVVHFNN